MRYNFTMNRILSVMLVLLGIVYFSCKDTSYVVGSENVDEIEDVIFTITSYTVYSTKLEGKGTVKNTGSSTIYPSWYIEGHFYSDSTLSFKLGGDRQVKTVSLEPGTTMSWTLEFSSNDIDESLYPNFKIAQLRAYKEKD